MFKHFFIITLLLSSCAHEKNGMSLGKRSLDEFYIGSGVIRYFQPSIPQWINYSQGGQCHRKTVPYYLNYSNILSSFNLTYFEIMQLQYSFNNQYKKLLDSSGLKFLSSKEEEKLFYTESEKVHAKIYTFIRPEYQRINLIWADKFIVEKKGINKLKALMNSKEMDLGHPVMISLCKTRSELLTFLESESLNNRNIKVLTFEAFSPFNYIGQLQTNITIDLDKIFKKDQSLHMFFPEGEKLTKEIQGTFIIHNK